MSARNFWKACVAIGVVGLFVTVASAKHNVVVYGFAGGSDGNFPYGGLVRDSLGNLYGTTGNGGLAHCGGGCGTLFRLAPNGTHTVLHAFTGKLDGSYPSGDLVGVLLAPPLRLGEAVRRDQRHPLGDVREVAASSR